LSNTALLLQPGKLDPGPLISIPVPTAGPVYSHPRSPFHIAPESLSTSPEYARRSSGRDLCSNRTAILLDFYRPSADKNFVLKRVCRFISRLMLGHCFGAFRRPAALGLLLRIARPFGVSVPPKQVCKVQQRTLCKFFLGSSQKADLRHLGAGPTRQLRST